MDVPFGGRGRVAGDTERAAHEGVAPKQVRQGRLALEREGKVGQRTQGDEHDFTGPTASLLHNHVNAVTFGEGPAGRRQLGISEARGTVRLRRRLQPPSQRDLAAQRDLDIGSAGEFEDSTAVDRDLPSVDVARNAGDCDQLGVR